MRKSNSATRVLLTLCTFLPHWVSPRQAKIAIAFLFGQLHFNNVTSHALFYGGHLVMRSKRCAMQNQGITLNSNSVRTTLVKFSTVPGGGGEFGLEFDLNFRNSVWTERQKHTPFMRRLEQRRKSPSIAMQVLFSCSSLLLFVCFHFNIFVNFLVLVVLDTGFHGFEMPCQ